MLRVPFGFGKGQITVEISADGDREEEDNSLNIWQLRRLYLSLHRALTTDNTIHHAAHAS